MISENGKVASCVADLIAHEIKVRRLTLAGLPKFFNRRLLPSEQSRLPQKPSARVLRKENPPSQPGGFSLSSPSVYERLTESAEPFASPSEVEHERTRMRFLPR
jgi:hypothetical protein